MHRSVARSAVGLFVLASVSLTCVGCHPDRTRSQPTSHRDHRTESILLVADNQYHELYGAPTFLQSVYADRYVEVALRPAQQRLYGDELFAWVLQQSAPSSQLILHLGDAMDVSCLSEWQRFERTMARTGKPWLMVPGNHDGFFTGNLSPAPGDSNFMWTDAYGTAGWCLRCAETLDECTEDPTAEPRVVDKNKFIRHYLQHLGVDTAAPTFADSGEDALTLGSLRAQIAWVIDRKKPWRSFVIQEVRLPSDCASAEGCDPVVLYLVDTNQVQKRPKFLPVRPLGHTGGLGENQIEILERWSSQVAKTTGAFVIAGHHPLDTIDAGRADLESLLTASEAPLYVSAHTHAGYWNVHGKGDDAIAELNVGSVLDWPVESRTLRIEKRDGAPARFESDLIAVTTTLANDAQSGPASVLCEGDWKIAEGSLLHVTRQQRYLEIGEYLKILSFDDQINRARETMSSALHAELLQYQHEHKEIGSQADDIAAIRTQIARLEEVQPVEKTTRVEPQNLLRKLRDEDDSQAMSEPLRHYRVCQALWASEDDFDRTSKTRVNRMKGDKGHIEASLAVCVLPDCV